MTKPTLKPKATLIAGIIYKNEKNMEKARYMLEKKFGKISMESAAFKFEFTTYYNKEMGFGLFRKYMSFKKKIAPESLAQIKHATNKIEDYLTNDEKRSINIDPGYVTDAKLILATAKNQQHRIYLKKGIFAEVTLRFVKKSFIPWEWTYPDYKAMDTINFFNSVRNSHLKEGRTL